MTPTHRLGLLAAAIAAVSLTSSCDDSSDNGPGSLKITTANAPFVAADGAALIAGAMDVDEEASPENLDLGVGVAVAGSGAKPQGLSFIKLGALVRAHAEAGETAAMVAASLPTGAAVVSGTTVDCETSGSYIYFSNSTSWGITYNNCVDEYSEEGEGSSYESRYTMNGTATGSYGTEVGYGGWSAEYENLRSTYNTRYSNPEATGSYAGEYEVNGSFDWFYDYGGTAGYGGYGGNYTDHYSATDLTVKYKYTAKGDSEGEAREGAGTVVYDTYEFAFYYEDGYWFWEGDLYARDSERGVWSISTPVPFGVNYACQLVTGEVRYSGVIHDEEDSNRGSNVLVISGNGMNDTVTYDLFEADGVTEISSEEHDWLDYYSEYENEGC